MVTSRPIKPSNKADDIVILRMQQQRRTISISAASFFTRSTAFTISRKRLRIAVIFLTDIVREFYN